MKKTTIKWVALALGVVWTGTGFTETSHVESLLSDLAPAKPAAAAEAAKPAEVAKPAPEAKPVEEAKPAPEAKPVEEAKPVPEVKPIEVAKPAPEAKPIEEDKIAEKTQGAETETDEIDLNADDSAEAAKGRPVV